MLSASQGPKGETGLQGLKGEMGLKVQVWEKEIICMFENFFDKMQRFTTCFASRVLFENVCKYAKI